MRAESTNTVDEANRHSCLPKRSVLRQKRKRRRKQRQRLQRQPRPTKRQRRKKKAKSLAQLSRRPTARAVGVVLVFRAFGVAQAEAQCSIKDDSRQ